MNGIENEIELTTNKNEYCLNIENTNKNEEDDNINNNEEEIHFYEHGAHFQYASLYEKLFHLAELQKQSDYDFIGINTNVNQQSRNVCKSDANYRHNNLKQNDIYLNQNQKEQDNIDEIIFHSIENKIKPNNKHIDLHKEPANNIIKNICA
jgi:hypothetical protein